MYAELLNLLILGAVFISIALSYSSHKVEENKLDKAAEIAESTGFDFNSVYNLIEYQSSLGDKGVVFLYLLTIAAGLITLCSSIIISDEYDNNKLDMYKKNKADFIIIALFTSAFIILSTISFNSFIGFAIDAWMIAFFIFIQFVIGITIVLNNMFKNKQKEKKSTFDNIKKGVL